MANKEFEYEEFFHALSAGEAFTFGRLDVTVAHVLGRDFLFCTDTHRDVVQQKLREGRFYEQDELEVLRSHIPADGVFADIGSNVGNHAMFAAAFFGASRVICFEPNPRAIRLLCANVALNQMSDIIDLSNLGVGVSDETRGDFGMETRGKRLGSLRMLEGGGEIGVVKGDSVLFDVAPDIVKIDVEGMEMKVLSGLSKTIKRHSPAIYVEIDNRHSAEFQNWLSTVDYEVIQNFPQNAQNENYLIKSRKKS